MRSPNATARSAKNMQPPRSPMIASSVARRSPVFGVLFFAGQAGHVLDCIAQRRQLLALSRHLDRLEKL
jgi:hypothetical protein